MSRKLRRFSSGSCDEFDNIESKLVHLQRIIGSTHPGYNRQLPGQSLLPQIFFGRRLDRMSVRINCDEVYPNIFIGDEGAARNKSYLKLIGITHVLNTAEGIGFCQVNTGEHFYGNSGIKYMGLNVMDVPQAKISIHFAEAADFIDKAIEGHGRVLIHCLMGLSRSATITIAYLMIKRGMTLEEALRTVRRNRECRPNDGFLRQLIDLEFKIRNGGGFRPLR
ncbi:dual specificity protein phosphatase 3-like isoform X1 [Leptotrombidium deliense]|uniref:Dual specificity protein phosphatase n=1 Tax=Leptotrombidium deliense TaxID=299467 RepID=A0A443SLR9_9ACAR|nr:dual specificity protein phosphatase 3-like isoform X1 [Leptotrombidium deliense]